MNIRWWKKAIIAALALGLLVGPSAWSQSSQKTTKPLSPKEDPRLIGKRDINKRQWNFYSLEREVQLGRQLAAEVDRYMQILDDPIISEYINRVGQNLVLHSDAKVPTPWPGLSSAASPGSRRRW